jgi:hypothetical protein
MANMELARTEMQNTSGINMSESVEGSERKLRNESFGMAETG